MAVTAAMPMTTPRTVNPERSLFLPKVRKEIIKRSNKSTPLPRSEHPFGPNHHGLAIDELAAQQFRKMIFHQPKRDRDGPQQVLLLNPDDAAATLLGQI